MTSAAPTRTTTAPATDAVRLSLKPSAPTTGFVDGAWWPRSRDLVAELVPLLEALAPVMGTVERVSYNLTAWGATARRLPLAGGLVHLAGYHTQAADTIDVIGRDGLLTLLVVPPDAPAATADHAMTAAAETGNLDAIASLLGR
ncbi:MAG: DUF5994 family protein [Pseudonocardia sp.]|nr:DUF5994 family protein [Pseudonocardia sp.]